MSGPITAIVIAHPVAALLAAAGIRAALALAEGYADAADLRQSNLQDRDATRADQATASEQGRHAMAEQARAAETAFDQLATFAERLGIDRQVRATRPSQPDANDFAAVAAYIRALQMLAEELRSILLTESARQMDKLPDHPEQIAIPATAAPLKLAQRLLARIAHLGAPPQDIAAIALELDNTLPGERADLLATELRARIQAHIEALQQRQVQEATAVIIEQSLKDLGYQVEEVADTLFVEGGVVHFRRQSWGEYMVRMRIDAKAGSANFNVIRAVAAGHNERSVLDHIAEDRWCAEFPALLNALEVRGVQLNVTRRLEAGELPVQLVEAGKLPTFADEDNAIHTAKPLAREIK